MTTKTATQTAETVTRATLEDRMAEAKASATAAIEQLAAATRAYHAAFSDLSHAVFDEDGHNRQLELNAAAGPHRFAKGLVTQMRKVGGLDLILEHARVQHL